ncbi:MAG: family 43 glycosylhydrolase, partial [Bacteroidota bacterium]|nr:family 43 glycosylhydrolase [Bacteroidota bacterium]
MQKIILIVAITSLQAQNFNNPILSGGYPDPSICRVGDEFFMVNSSFEYFPALPIHKSKDLVNWELIGHGLN